MHLKLNTLELNVKTTEENAHCFQSN